MRRLSFYQTTPSRQNYQVTVNALYDPRSVASHKSLLRYRPAVPVPVHDDPVVLLLPLLQNCQQLPLLEDLLDVSVFSCILHCFQLRFDHFAVLLQILVVAVQHGYCFPEPLAKNYGIA